MFAQENDQAGSSSGSSGTSNPNSNLSQEVLSKRAIKTEYLKTLKKSLLDEEISMMEGNKMNMGPPPTMDGVPSPMQLNAAHQHNRMMEHHMALGPGTPHPHALAVAPGGGNQAANAVAVEAANRAAAMRQNLMRQRQQHQHNHANCVQGMCMHQMYPPREMGPRHLMPMGPHAPYMPPGPVPPHTMAPMRMGGANPMHNPAASAMMKCRPGCNLNHVHNVMTPPSNAPNMFMPMGPMHPPPPPFGNRPGAPASMMMNSGPMDPTMMVPNNGMNVSGMPMPPVSNSTGVRPMMTAYSSNMMPLSPAAAAGVDNAPPSVPAFSGGMPPFPHQPTPHRMPQPPDHSQQSQQSNCGNNPMINVIMTIGGGAPNAPVVNNMAPHPSSAPPQPHSQMAMSVPSNYPPGAQMMPNQLSGMHVKQEANTAGPFAPSQQQQPLHPNMMYRHQPQADDPQAASQRTSGVVDFGGGQVVNSYPQNLPSSGDTLSVSGDFYPVSQMQQPLDPSMQLQPPMESAAGMPPQTQPGAPSQQPPFDMANQSMLPSNDQRQISVNVDKNMFMVQSNLNGAQFNVQGSALPQGSNLRTNVAVNMHVQSNPRYPPANNNSSGSFKFGSNFDPSSQSGPAGPMHQAGNLPPNSHMWIPQGDAPLAGQPPPQPPQPMMAGNLIQRPSNSFDVYSNLSEFKPISDTPKGTVEYLPDGKTREKSKDNSGDPSLQPSSSTGTHSSLPVQPDQPNMHMASIYDPSNTFSDLHFGPL